MTRALGRYACAFLLLSAALLVVMAGSRNAPGAAAAGVTEDASSPTSLPAASGNQQIQVVSQSLWVTSGVTPDFELDLRIAGVEVATTSLQVAICPRIVGRLDFAASLLGQDASQCPYQQVVRLASLPKTTAGAWRVVVPLYLPNGQYTVPAGALPTFYPSTLNNGTYPLTVRLVNTQGVTFGQPITTYLVSTTASIAANPKLSVSWVVPVEASDADPTAPLSSASAASLEAEIAALGAHPVKLTLAVDPSTLIKLDDAGPAGRRAVSSLRKLVAAGDELQAEPYVAIDVAGMTAAGQGADVARQYRLGAATLKEMLGQGPDTRAWAFSESPLEPALLAQARQEGATELVMPGSGLSVLPVGKTSFAQTTTLEGYPQLTAVAGTDTALALHFTNSGDQVLEAEQFLAELAEIDLETPALTRGVAIVVPEGWQPNAQFVDTVVAGLANSPVLAAQTLQQFFATVPLAKNLDGADVPRSLLPAPSAVAVTDTAQITQARAQIASLTSTVAVPAAEIASLDLQVLTAESSALSPAEQTSMLADIRQRVTNGVNQVRLAPQLSVTLTSTSAAVPVTVLNTGKTLARLQLVLSSQKLSFRSFTSAAGTCVSVGHTTEECNLDIPAGATLLRVPVETRTSGVFSLDLELRSGDGHLVIGEARYTVRSTAVSDVAVALMVVAAVLLGVWWVRDRRHGRRARQLVEPPNGDEDDDLGEAGTPTPGGGEVTSPAESGPATVPISVVASPEQRWSPAPPDRLRRRRRTSDGSLESAEGGLWVDNDPVVAEFFSTPPPFFVPGTGRVREERKDKPGPPAPPGSADKPTAPGRSGSGR